MKILGFLFSVVLGVLGSLSIAGTDKPIITNGSMQVISGRAQVTDGDSLRIGDERIRLFGIDALEGKQTCNFSGDEWACGRSSRKALERAIGRNAVSCTVYDKDKYKRSVSICRVGETDLNEGQVRNGWAVAYTKYSKKYASAEKDAHANQRGIWRSEFERPEDYRRRIRQVNAERARQNQSRPVKAGCDIKGNISSGSGNRIFHVRGQRDYERTSINTKKGERWFCTEQEAWSAGWKKAAR
ncbi:thermonuclease family protein [Hirschia maritima]|uniref:thermonuclease family protein n=1 Tax=Hirschia maritima TaxID=1121961 RepID=UPI00037918E6|nr:thermonuclease family protein [Hirschia maritima]